MYNQDRISKGLKIVPIASCKSLTSADINATRIEMEIHTSSSSSKQMLKKIDKNLKAN